MKINIGVLFGGESVEHEVSIISAIQAMEAIDKNKYDVFPIYVSKNREFYYSDDLKNIASFTNLSNINQKADKIKLIKNGSKVSIEKYNKSLFSKKNIEIDVFIPVMHGTNGEDGSIQGLLEMLKVPYAGCDVIGAACGQDKVVMKHILQNSNIATYPWVWIYGHEFEVNKDEIVAKIETLGYPVILKPCKLGSSVGISVAHDREQLTTAILETRQYDNKILVEKMITNLTEINCSVLGDCYECTASVLEQVGKGAEILDFKDKYLGNGSKSTKTSGMASASRIVPAPLSDDLTKSIQSMACDTFKVLSASGVCRIDFMIDNDTNLVYVNEINTIPGSLSFYLWKESNLTFTQLMDKLIKLAIDRYRRNEKMITSFDSNILANFNSNSAKGSKGIK